MASKCNCSSYAESKILSGQNQNKTILNVCWRISSSRVFDTFKENIPFNYERDDNWMFKADNYSLFICSPSYEN